MGVRRQLEAPGRVELPTRSLGNCCSIHLSYGALAHQFTNLRRNDVAIIFIPYATSSIQLPMLVCGRNPNKIAPVAIIAALVIMILGLLYAAFNRAHEAAPQAAPMHQTN
jgi:hypothetical protein